MYPQGFSIGIHMGGATFSKLMEMEGLKFFSRKGGYGKMGGLSRNRGLPYYTGKKC